MAQILWDDFVCFQTMYGFHEVIVMPVLFPKFFGVPEDHTGPLANVE